MYEPRLSLKLTLVKSLLLTIPFAFAGSFFGPVGIWTGIAAANIIGAFYAGHLLNRWLREKDSALVDHSPLADYVNDFRALRSYLSR